MYARVQLTVESKAERADRAAQRRRRHRRQVRRVHRRAGAPHAPARPPAQGSGQPALDARSSCRCRRAFATASTSKSPQGVDDGARVITTGAGALKDGDRIVAAGRQGRGREGRGERANREGGQPSRERPMSIPRLAIERPVTMFMLSGVIVLIGAMSLIRLPVDLMPDVDLPEHHGPRRVRRRRTAGDGGARHAAARAVAGGGRRPRAARVDGVGRQQPRHAEFVVGHRPERGGRRRAEPHRPRARPAARGSRPADRVQVRLELACRS